MLNKFSETIDRNTKSFLTEAEMTKFLEAARKSRHKLRDFCLMLLAYRHGLRVSELINIRSTDLDLDSATIYVRRLKANLSTQQPVEDDEIQATKRWLKERENYPNSSSNYLFLSERGPMTRQSINYLVKQIGQRAKLNFKISPHMLRHSTGYYLAKKGCDIQLIQEYLGHQNIIHTVRYTQAVKHRFVRIMAVTPREYLPVQTFLTQEKVLSPLLNKV